MILKRRKIVQYLIQLIILIGNDFNSNSELQITIRRKNDVVPCPKKGDVTHALIPPFDFHFRIYKRDLAILTE
jgi:hypothetical protein